MIKDYFNNPNINEARETILDLSTNSMNDEIIVEACSILAESNKLTNIDLTITLLKELYVHKLLSLKQIETGFNELIMYSESLLIYLNGINFFTYIISYST